MTPEEAWAKIRDDLKSNGNRFYNRGMTARLRKFLEPYQVKGLVHIQTYASGSERVTLTEKGKSDETTST